MKTVSTARKKTIRASARMAGLNQIIKIYERVLEGKGIKNSIVR